MNHSSPRLAPRPLAAIADPAASSVATRDAPSWRPAESLCINQVDLATRVETLPLGWQAALARPPKVRLLSAQLYPGAAAVASLPIRPPSFRIFSFRFPDPVNWQSSVADPPPNAAAIAEGRSPARVTRTRIKPPGDAIRLEDRLYYVLQPSLEALLGGDLTFPCDPFPYQFEGVAFLYPRFTAVLADEMGLGKSMQAITAMRLLVHSGEIRSVLVICPKPLVSNWRRELALWAPELPVATIEGDAGRRRWQWRLPDAPIKIANYELLHRDREVLADSSLFFDLVVLDEAQRIKNRFSHTSQAARSIGRRRSWALTGTPVENSPEDLVGIFEFLAPGYLSSDTTPQRIGQAVSDFVLRRTKDKVLKELPPKMFRDAQLDLTPQQRATYELAEQEGVLRLTEMGDSASIQHVFELVLRLKQICNFDPATGESSKFDCLLGDLEEVAASGRKAIVFSQWVTTLRTLARRLTPFRPLEYHGRIGIQDRERAIEQFRDDPNRHVLLLSYGAGGVGLNLQFAGYVFLFDRWWNPAVEDQAINRAHRIGAAGPVTVTRFLTLSTIEQRIDQVLAEKREIFDSIFSGVAPRRNLGLTQQEIFGLFQLRSPSGPIDLVA